MLMLTSTKSCMLTPPAVSLVRREHEGGGGACMVSLVLNAKSGVMNHILLG